ncbi:hypothetical protein [Longitalea arenae]|uniref:hypothetical protein n=1 Tax=Longitalea arenae TaxID=2812558 RepID=UPI0019681A1A|nr:hypothetical protein [Longitalea arenae]
MNYLQTSPFEQSFKDFLFKNRFNRLILYLAATAIIIQFGIFKYFYPFASYIHGDSFSYINAAHSNLTINTYLIGYSKFLRLFNIFAKPDYMLVAFQYLFIQCGVLFLLFTIFYFYKARRITQIILFCFMLFNPLFLHLGNMVSSDGLFLSLSCIWFSLLLWLIHRPTNKIIIWHGIVLFIAFTVRYNALIYPVIAGLAFWMSNISLRKKITGLAFGLLLCGLFVGFTMWRYKVLTGYWQYSPFSGWQWANNAMYAYRYVDSAEWKPVPQRFKALDNMIRQMYARTKNLLMDPKEREQTSTFYMWSSGLPLMQYRDSLFNLKDTQAIELKKWASMGPLYTAYGLHIIRQYPLHYLRHFVWPNSHKYYAPPVEFLAEYNGGRKYVNEQTKRWFGYKSTKVRIRMDDNKVIVLNFYPYLSGVINWVMFFGLIFYLLLKGWKFNSVFNKTILLAAFLWLTNAFFTICASSAALRFQSFPIILTTTFSLLVVDWMFQLMNKMKHEENKQKSMQERLQGEAIA